MKFFFSVKSSIFISLLCFIISIYFSGINNRPEIYQKNIQRNFFKNENVEYLNIKKKFFNFNYNEKIFFKNLKQITVPVKKAIGNGVGTAFKLNTKTWITARHVVFDCSSVYLDKKKVEKIILTDSSDIAILILDSDFTNLDYKNFDNFNNPIFDNKIKIGEEVVSIGFPSGFPGQARLSYLGYQKMYQKGNYNLIEPVRVWVERDRYPTNLKNMGGISGGLLYSNRNGLVGIHVANSIRKGRAYSITEYSLYKIISILNNNNNPIFKKNILMNNNWIEISNYFRENGLIKKIFCSR